MLGEVGQCVLQVLERNAVAVALVDGVQAGDGAVVQVEGEHVLSGYVDEVPAALWDDVMMEHHVARSGDTVEQKLLGGDGEAVGIQQRAGGG